MATYYVRSSGGSDGNAGTSFGAAWATIAKAISTVTTGDEIRICADGTHTTTSTLDPHSAGLHECFWVGANGSDGSIDGTVATIQAVASWGGGDLWYCLGSSSGFCFNLEFDANGLAVQCVDTNSNWRFVNCTFREATGVNVIRAGGSGNELSFAYCRFLDADGFGAQAYGANFYRCYFAGNGDHGLRTQYAGVYECVFYDNAGDGILASLNTCIVNCVSDSNDGDGFDNQTYSPVCVNCVATRNGGYGFTSDLSGQNLILIGCMSGTGSYANTSGHASSYVDLEIGAITNADPLYEGPSDSPPDFTPGSGSPMLNAGWPLPYFWHGGLNMDAGAVLQHT